MSSLLMLLYAAIAYVVGLVNIAWIVGFIADFGVPKSINDGSLTTPGTAVAIDVALVLLFGLHHSVTARAAFKQRWSRFVSPAIERATYLYMTALMTGVLITFWKPIPVTVWQVESAVIANSLHAAYLLVWALMFAATFHFGHFGFFGLQQAWHRFQGYRPARSSLSVRYLYAVVRHPISLGWMLTAWLTPHMTVGRLVWAGAVTLYVLLATPFEEADLIEEMGDAYRRYRERVPAFLPIRKRQRPNLRS